MLFIGWELGIPNKAYPFLVILVLAIYTIPPISFVSGLVTIPIMILLGLGGILNWNGGYNG